jgi:excisionase family DNA binding protein
MEDHMTAEEHPDLPRFIRPKNVAENLSIDIQTVYRAIYSGELPSIRFGRGKKTILIRPEDANAWITANTVASTTETER